MRNSAYFHISLKAFKHDWQRSFAFGYGTDGREATAPVTHLLRAFESPAPIERGRSRALWPNEKVVDWLSSGGP